jgi:hypothetical protein
VRDTWEAVAKRIGIRIKAYAGSKDFDPDQFSKKTPIFIDHNLSNENGLKFAKNIIKHGFSNVTLATGNQKAIHPNINQIGKEFPLC